jgi:aspartate aminotransferase
MDLLSTRINGMVESSTLAMAAKAREMKQNGFDVISLSLGEPDFNTPKHIQEGAKQAIDDGKYFSYAPVNGYLDLRSAISEKFKTENNLNYTPDQVVVSNGAKQSLANLFLALLDPGDEVVIYTPYWVSYSALVELAEGKCVFIKGDIKDDFKANAVQLQEAITNKTKAVIFSSPCNPTGSVFTKDDFKGIVKVLSDYPDIIVIADEIYELINFAGAHVSIGSLPGMQERTVTVNGFAKGFAMTGWRVGYIGAPLWLAKAANKIQGQITSANCSIAQRAALTALTSPKEASKEMANAYYQRRQVVYELLKKIPDVEVNMPQGAFYFFPNVSSYFGKQGINNASDLCIYLLEEAHVSLVSGEGFGEPDCIRLSYAASEENLKIAIARIAKALEKLI